MARQRLWQVLSGCALIIGGSNAQCNKATTTIRGSADVEPLSACKTYTGVIAVATDSEPVIELNGVEKIEGDFIAADNPFVTTFGSNSLVEATGKVEFSNLGVLANISLPKWERTGTLILDRVPSPTFTDFQQKGQQIYEVYVRNTTFPFFSGLTLVGAQIDVLEIVDNPYLQLVSFMAGNITQRAKITGNGGDLTLQLPNLTYAYSLEISNASQLTLPMLSSVSDVLDVSYSDASNLSMPELAYVGGDFVISNNRHISSLELGELVNVKGNLKITDNQELLEVAGLPYLSSVGGSLDMTGAFDSIDLPALGIVRNDITIDSTGSLDCSSISASLAKGSYSCNGNGASPSLDGASSPSEKGGLSAGAKAGIALGTIALVAAIIAAVAFFLVRRRQRLSTPAEMTRDNPDAAPEYPGEHKDQYEMEYYSVDPHYEGSQKDLIQRSSEMGRPTSGTHQGPEGRHEMFNTKDPPAAYELAAAEVQKETST